MMQAANDSTRKLILNSETLEATQQAEMIQSMVANLEERLQSSPNDIEGWLRLAYSFQVLGQVDESLAAYQHIINQEPNHSLALFQIGSISYKNGDFRNALHAWQRLLPLIPADASQQKAAIENFISQAKIAAEKDK